LTLLSAILFVTPGMFDKLAPTRMIFA